MIPPAHQLPISGYTITERLYLGSRTAVYRAIQTTQKFSVVIKVLRREYPTFGELVQFRNQYAIAKNLPIGGIVRPLRLEKFGNGYALVMADWGGISLEKHTQQQPLDLAETLAIAIQIADILQELHQYRVIHKDIKPGNILIHPESKEVKLIDFSIASVLDKETKEIQSPNTLEGTLAYLAPEQTGRMNRGIDYRSDFYAFGVTLYQLLTGTLPFAADDPLELVHCHIAKFATPADRVNTEVPEIVGAIVAKLMAKNTEDRYQSALGLKHDLQFGLSQWKETGSIAKFELAQRDLCDRFIIPENLYGRKKEVQSLLDAFERVAQGSSELMLVAGFSGIGKTAVVSEVHKPITRQKGYFIKGKFDQFNRNIPFCGFVQAFSGLVKQLLAESDEQINQWKTQILAALGNNAQVIIDVIPNLEIILGKQPAVPELSGSAPHNRFNLVFSQFVRVFTKQEHPLVIFLDDLQWADSASLGLLKLLMSESQTNVNSLLLLGAYRDNEVFPAHPLMLCLQEIESEKACLNTITLEPLAESDINCLVADTLLCSEVLASPLSGLIYQKTKGNPFFTTQFLKGLYEDGYINFNRKENCWRCDLTKLRQLALTDDVVEFMVARLQKLSEATQDVLKLAACIGNRFDLATLAMICEKSKVEITNDLWSALQTGLIVPETQIYRLYAEGEIENISKDSVIEYRFLHDRVQQAAYALISQDQKQITHYRIGQQLFKSMSPNAREDYIFELVNQLNYGISFLDNPVDRYEIAQLNLIACRKARTATAYETGRKYAEVSLSLLGESAWQQHYKMTLELHTLTTELAFLCSDVDEMQQFADLVIENASTILDRAKVYRIIIQAKASKNHFLEAIDIARKFLKQLNIELPTVPTDSEIQQTINELESLFIKRKIEDLGNLAVMVDAQKIAIVEIVNSIMPAVYISNPPLFPILVCLTIRLSIEYGNTHASAYSYSCYGIIACTRLKKIEVGVKFGQLALQVIKQFNAKAVQPAVATAVGSCILHRKSHVQSMLGVLREGYENSLDIGNLEFAGYTAHLYCLASFWCTQDIRSLEKEVSAYCHALVRFNQLTSANYCRIFWQSTLNLLARSEYPTQLSGEVFEESEFLCKQIAASDLYGLYFFYLSKLMLCYLFNDLENAQKHLRDIQSYFQVGTGSVGEPIFYFYDSLIALSQLRKNSQETKSLWEKVNKNQAEMQQNWAAYAPMNYQHKYDLVKAEKNRVLGNKLEALELYDRAIAGAKENEYIQEEALANELAAKFYLDWGKEKIAAIYMQDAYYCYARWGAKGKTDDLEKRYPQLLAPIFQQEQINHTATIQTTISHAFTSNTGISDALDLTTIIKTSQAISEEIHLNKLLSTLMSVVIENAGADKGVFVSPCSSKFMIEAVVKVKSQGEALNISVIPSELLEQSQQLPTSLVHYVSHTGETLVINNLDADTKFAGDCYFQINQPQSILCTPILHQGKLTGILYLENNFAQEAFTSHRIELLTLLCSQAAISLENARLYENLEQKVQERTQELSQALEKLKATQNQLVESEKMAALGSLVAGIAHEINTPVGTSITVASNLRVKTQDFVNNITQGQLKRSTLNNYLEITQQSSDLLVQNLNRAGELVNSFKQVAVDQTNLELRKFRVKEYIKGVLLSLTPQLKQSPHKIKVSGDENLKINSYAGSLAQIITNLVMNSLIHGYPQGEAGQLNFEILSENQDIKIIYSDDGCGIPEEHLDRIFQPFFTTKRNQGGTGLGLHIVYNLIIHKLQGSIEVNSLFGKGTQFIIIIPSIIV